MPMDWDKLRIFHAAAEAGSFTHAGEQLRMSQSAVSRQVSALEKELKVALFHRHARGLVLTEQGEMLFGTAAEIMGKLSTAETLLTDTTTKPSGDLRITAPIGLGTVWVTQRLREFLELYPDIRIELVLNDEQIAIAMRAADVAIWTAEPQQSDLIRRRLFNMKIHAFRSRDSAFDRCVAASNDPLPDCAGPRKHRSMVSVSTIITAALRIALRAHSAGWPRCSARRRHRSSPTTKH
jgi:DNA-binding transcriptional LysR family regulator